MRQLNIDNLELLVMGEVYGNITLEQPPTKIVFTWQRYVISPKKDTLTLKLSH